MTDEERIAQLVVQIEAIRVELGAIQTALAATLPANHPLAIDVPDPG